MIVAYTNEALGLRMKEILSENKVVSELQYKTPTEQVLREFMEVNKGRAIGGPMPEGWMDLGSHLVTFVLTREILMGVVENAIWDSIKYIYTHAFKHLPKLKKENLSSNIAIQTDQWGQGEGRKTISFVLNAGLSDAEITDALKMIPEVRKRTLSFLEVADITGTTQFIEFHYLFSRWELNIHPI